MVRLVAVRWWWFAVVAVAGLLLTGQRAVHGIVMPDSGSILSWGSNAEGAFGTGEAYGLPTPTSIKRISVGLTSKKVKLVAVGPTHSVAVADDNTVFTWGANTEGQLGTGDLDQRNLPTAVNDLNSVLAGKVIVEVAAALNYTLVRTQDNRIIGWGTNAYGQLGPGFSSTRSTVPIEAVLGGMAGKTITRIACAGGHSLALTSEGNVFGWGYSNYGEAGSNYSNINPTPGLIAGIGVASGRPVQDIAAGYYHSVALLQDGSVWVWGSNYSNQFGTGPNQPVYNYVPQPVNTSGVLAGKTVNAISAGMYHVLALANDGQIYGWGDNSSGQLGNGTTTPTNLPVAVTMTALAGKTVAKLHSGYNHNYAVATDNTVFGWGVGTSGQLGNNTLTTLTTPTRVLLAGGLTGKTVLPTSYALGSAHTLAFDNSGSAGNLYAWGNNSDGRLGISSLERWTVPVAVAGRELNSKTFTQVAAGGDFAAALASDGTVFTWGANADGQLGNGAAGTPANVAWAIAGGSLNSGSVALTGGSVTSGSLRVTVASTTGLVAGMSVGGIAAIPAGATVASVTNATSFNLSSAATASGTGTVTASGQFAQPAVTAIAAGQRHVLAVAGGKVYAWGDNASSQLGDSTSTDRSLPVATVGTGVLSGKTVTGVAAGLSHSLALDSSGTLYSWGAAASGQLGNGSTSIQASPVAVTMSGALAGRTATVVAAGGNRSYAIAGGSLYGWGDNTGGVLGNGGTLNSSTAVLINGGGLAGKTVTHVAAGYNHTVARTSDGQVYAWGINDRGQLGTGNLTSASTPTLVKMTGALSGKTVLKVYSGPASLATIVQASDNKLYSWGGRGLGQLGNGSWGTVLEPVLVSATGSFVSAAAGDGFSVSAASDSFVSTWGGGGHRAACQRPRRDQAHSTHRRPPWALRDEAALNRGRPWNAHQLAGL